MRFDRFTAVCRLLAVVFCWQLAAAALAADAPAQLPNIVVIVVDDFGWTDLACYGSKYYRTPNVDRLAADGMRFTQAYAACPVCSPTRAALMTGKYPARLHLTDYIPGKPNSRRASFAAGRFSPGAAAGGSHGGRSASRRGLRDRRDRQVAHGRATASSRRGKVSSSAWEATTVARCAATLLLILDGSGPNLPGLDDAPPGEYLADRLTTEAEKFIEANRAAALLPVPAALRRAHADHGQGAMKSSRYEAMKPTGLQRNPIYARHGRATWTTAWAALSASSTRWGWRTTRS